MLPAGPFGTPEEQTTGQFPDSVHQGQVGLFVTPTAVGQYSIPPPGMPRGKVIQTQGLTTTKTLAWRQGSEQGEVERPMHKESGESLGCQGHVSFPAPKWDVDLP